MKKITVSGIRSLMNDVTNEKISFSRMVELINEQAGDVKSLPCTEEHKLLESGFKSVGQMLPELYIFIEAAYLVVSAKPYFKIRPSYLKVNGRFTGESDWVRVKYWRYPPDMNKK